MEKQSFFYRILLPSLAAIVLFLSAMYVFVIPNYRENLLDKKRETIRELTNTVWSVLKNMDQQATDSVTLARLKQNAADIIAHMRYGDEQKDYFWITDTIPTMIMHPYRPQMNGMDLSDYADPEGKRFFIEIRNLVKETGQGYIDYKWQWKDDSLVVVPKLSFVKIYEPWGWIIGTGIYVEDVQKEISSITRQLAWISFFITIIIGIIIFYLARRNYEAEQLRQKAQILQKETMEKYKKLVEASTDGVLMTMNGEIVYCNPFLMSLMGFDPQITDERDSQLLGSLNCFLQIKNQNKETEGSQENSEIVKEQKVKKKNGVMADVIITRSRFDIENKKGFIYTVKDVSRHKDVERELDMSMEKFKSIADRLNLGIFRCTLGRQSRFIEINKKALSLLGYKSLSDLEDIQVQDFFHERDEKRDVIRAISESTFIKDRLLRIKKSDGSIIPVIISLFPVKDIHDRSVYCDGIIMDAYEQLGRESHFDKKPEQLSASILLKPVKDFILQAPVCDMHTPVEMASRLMTMKNADITLIKNETGDIIGIITHRDISRRIVAKSLDVNLPISRIMSAPVISVSEHDMVMDAFGLMMEQKVSYVAVNTSDKLKPGYISLLALSELRRNTPEFLIHSIGQAKSVQEIRELMHNLPPLIHTLIETGTSSTTAGKLISRVSDSVTEKIINDAIALKGKPPVPFVFLALGSEGRREQSLATDQDNAIIYLEENKEQAEMHNEYFLDFGKTICTMLDGAGYPFCTGDVMAMKPQWCMSLAQMKERVTSWIQTPNPVELLNAGIFFDFRPVYGDFNIANDLQRFCLQQAKDKNVFFYNLVQNTINIKIKTSTLGKTTFSTDDKKDDFLNIKEPIMAITGITRMWALKFGISEKNTIERLMAMQSVNFMSASFTEEFSQAYKYLTQLRITNQLRQIESDTNPDNYIHPATLSEIDRMMLKKIFSAITAHQSRLGTEFRIM
jgi:PAS domain S-box-containing protein